MRVKYEGINSYFEDGTNAFCLVNCYLPQKLEDLLAECYLSVLELAPDISLPHMYVKVPKNIDDFLTYVLKFEDISPIRKFATIYSFLSLAEDSNYAFNVDENDVVYDVLTRQFEPPQDVTKFFSNNLMRFYAVPAFPFMVKYNSANIIKNGKHIEHETMDYYAEMYFKNWFKGSLQDYHNRLGLFNFLNKQSKSLSKGIQQGFAPTLKCELFSIHAYGADKDAGFLDFDAFVKYVDFDNDGKSPVPISSVKKAWAVFKTFRITYFNMCTEGMFKLDESNFGFVVNWLFNHFDENSEEIVTGNIFASIKNVEYLNLTLQRDEIMSYTANVKPLYALYLYHHLREDLFYELMEWDENLHFALLPMNLQWLLKINESGQNRDVPLDLLAEIYDEEVPFP